MATYSNLLMRSSNSRGRRLSDKKLFLTAAIVFPLLVFVGYFKTYYFSTFFHVNFVANNIVHAHAIVMTLWVMYFTTQIWLARSKNIRLHITLGAAGIALAALVVTIGMWAAIDAHLIRKSSPPGISPYGFFALPLIEMSLFAALFAGAIYYRKRSAEHKTLMLLTAINFLPPALVRIPVAPADLMVLQAFGVPAFFALFCLAWHTFKHRQLNKIFAFATVVTIISFPLEIFLAGNKTFISFIERLAS